MQIIFHCFLGVIIAICTALYIMNRLSVSDWEDLLLEYEFRFKRFFHVGLYIYSKLSPKLPLRHNQKIYKNVIMLYGKKRLEQFYVIHYIQKIVLIYVTTLTFCFLGLIGNFEVTILPFFIIIIFLIPIWVDKQLDRKIDFRKTEILLDFPEFINKLTLLVNAGLSFNSALVKISSDLDNHRSLSKEILMLVREISSGKPMNQAYEDMAYRCRIPEITRFVTTILQNINKGSDNLVYVLKILANEAWMKRKEIARKKGDEAAAKLVFPMVLVFAAITIIVLAPAFIAMDF